MPSYRPERLPGGSWASNRCSNGSSGPSGPVRARSAPPERGPTGPPDHPGPYCKRLHVFLQVSRILEQLKHLVHPGTAAGEHRLHTCAHMCTDAHRCAERLLGAAGARTVTRRPVQPTAAAPGNPPRAPPEPRTGLPERLLRPSQTSPKPLDTGLRVQGRQNGVQSATTPRCPPWDNTSESIPRGVRQYQLSIR